MVSALGALMEGVIDYAGLFPPAKLGMQEAVEEFIRHKKGFESFLVRRFVCTVDRLAELSEALDDIPISEGVEPFAVAVIGSRADSFRAFYSLIKEDQEAIEAFTDEMSRRCTVEAYEVRLPDDGEVGKIERSLKVFEALDVFLELPWNDDLDDRLHALAEVDWIAAKVRTGGLTPAEFPSTKQLAHFISECLALGLRFKLTAGMHHPLRHHNALINADEHGFLNVLVAAALAEANDLNTSQIEAVLDEAENKFRFSTSEVTYGDFQADLESIVDVRSLYLSYGSCSIDDPVRGLAELGLLEVARS